ncbi:MAG TPA: PqqD family protein [Vicinamibacteria bacterium]|nr:PqqD family protein [Vicinamibacteria bacterium]
MASSSGFVPRRRPDGLVTENLQGETLLYVEATHRAFCLNPSAARVWDAIDGRRDVTAIARQVDLDGDLVLGTLHEMGEAGLLASVAGLSAPGVDLSRRRLVRAGLVAIPFIVAITVPRAAEAASCTAGLPTGPRCTPATPCCTGICNIPTGTCG